MFRGKRVSYLLLLVAMIVLILPAGTAFAWPAGTTLWEPFDSYNTTNWSKSDGYKNGDTFFNCYWRAANANFSGGQMSLKVSPDSSANPPYACGEYKTNDSSLGYGLYEVSMKPSNVSGVISSFFTYTNSPVWDEIDIEFLGNKNTIQFNYYTNGVGGHEQQIVLPFDASAAFHTYAFDWQPSYIKWYIDGVLKATATTNLPSHPGKVIMNAWNTLGIDAWAGAYNGKTTTNVYYDWVKYTPVSAPFAGYYKIVSKTSGMNLDNIGQSTADNTAIGQSTSTGDDAVWQLVPDGSGSYKIINKYNGKLLSISGGSTSDGAKTVQYYDKGTADQRWEIYNMGSGYYKIINHQSGKALDNPSSLTSGTQYQQWADVNNDNQRFQIVRVTYGE